MDGEQGVVMIKRILLTLGVALALLGGSLVVAGVAAADDESEYPYCVKYLPAGVGTTYGGGHHTPNTGDWYSYGPVITVPSNSACEDITITWEYWDNWRWRVRFYPSSGGSYVNSWKTSGCRDLCSVLVATAVSNGTRFRFEGHKIEVGGGQWTYNRPMDVVL